jgi:uncharacterized protein (TIRG00374 family)
MHKKQIISFLIGGIVSVLTLSLAFRNVPFNDLIVYLRTINYWLILPAIGIIALIYLLRALRWKIILLDIKKVKVMQAFHPTMIGFFVNCIFPGRVGELVRPVLLKNKYHVPVTTGLATVAAERIFDLLTLIALFALMSSTIYSQPDLEGEYFGLHLNTEIIQTTAMGMIRLSIALLLFIGFLSIGYTRRFIKLLLAQIGKLVDYILPRFSTTNQRLLCFITKMIDNISIGLSLVHNPLQLFSCLGITAIIWSLTAFSYLIIALGCPGINLSIMELTTVMVIIHFAIALPSVPGYWGLWEAGGVLGLSLYGIAEKDALGFTLVNHAVQIFPVIGIGLISAFITSVNIWQISQSNSVEKSQSMV